MGEMSQEEQFRKDREMVKKNREKWEKRAGRRGNGRKMLGGGEEGDKLV